jgi:DNA-binding NarL/FixJ family response regulator
MTARRTIARSNSKEPQKTPATQHGIPKLSEREVEILVLLASGATNKEIWNKLSLSDVKLEAQLHTIFRKIKAPNRFQAILWVRSNLLGQT